MKRSERRVLLTWQAFGATHPAVRRGLKEVSFLAVCLSWTIGLGSCARGSDDRQTVIRRDSVGIEIVESQWTSWAEGEEWRVSTRPILTLGVAEGIPELQLFRVEGAGRLRDGSIAVLNAGTRSLTLFEPTGDQAKIVGRSGEGPGEFRSPRHLSVLSGDSLRVWDSALGRMSWFDATGTFIRSETVNLGTLGWMLGAFMEPFQDGGYVAPFGYGSTQAPPIEETQRPPFWLGLIPPDVSRMDTLGPFPGLEQVCVAASPRPTCTATVFPHRTTRGLGKDPDRLYLGDSERPEIRVLTPEGRVVRIIRLPSEQIPVSNEELEREIDRRTRSAEKQGVMDRERLVLSAAPSPDVFPFFGELFIDKQGFLWLEDLRRGPDARIRYRIFGPEGGMLGSVAVPEDLGFLEIGEDYILGVRTDDLGVEYVDMYQLERGGVS